MTLRNTTTIDWFCPGTSGFGEFVIRFQRFKPGRRVLVIRFRGQADSFAGLQIVCGAGRPIAGHFGVWSDGVGVFLAFATSRHERITNHADDLSVMGIGIRFRPMAGVHDILFVVHLRNRGRRFRFVHRSVFPGERGWTIKQTSHASVFCRLSQADYAFDPRCVLLDRGNHQDSLSSARDRTICEPVRSD